MYRFIVERGDPKSEAMLFSVPDFIGFACCEVSKFQDRDGAIYIVEW